MRYGRLLRAKQTGDTGRCAHNTGFRASSGVRACRVTGGLYLGNETLAPRCGVRTSLYTHRGSSSQLQPSGSPVRWRNGSSWLAKSSDTVQVSRVISQPSFRLVFCPDKLGRQDSGSSCCGLCLTLRSHYPVHGYTQGELHISHQCSHALHYRYRM